MNQESGRKIIVEMLKFDDITKKNENDPYKTFRVDYRQNIKQKREENQRLKEEIAKKQEEEAKNEVHNTKK